MSDRLFRLLSALYPRAWRERYANEFTDLCEEFIDAGESARWRLAVNILVAASSERLRSWSHSGHRLVIGGGAIAVLVVGILAAATGGFGSFRAALPSSGPVPINADVNGYLDLSRIPDFVSVMSHGQVVGMYTRRVSRNSRVSGSASRS